MFQKWLRLQKQGESVNTSCLSVLYYISFRHVTLIASVIVSVYASMPQINICI